MKKYPMYPGQEDEPKVIALAAVRTPDLALSQVLWLGLGVGLLLGTFTVNLWSLLP